MRSTSWIWVLMISCLFHSIICAERKKLKKQNDYIEETPYGSERKVTREMKKFNKYSVRSENTPEEDSGEKFRIKEIARSKKIQVIKFPFRNDKGRVSSKERKYIEKKNERWLSDKQEKKVIPMWTEIDKKKRKSKNEKNENSKEFSKLPSREFQSKIIINKESHENLEDMETKYSNSKRKSTKQQNGELSDSKGVQKTKRSPAKLNKHESEDGNNESQQDDIGFCISQSGGLDGCSNNMGDASSHIPDAKKQEEQLVQPKKVKYSTKFAHEKASKKKVNKEAEHILKLHRKAEANPEYARRLKGTNRFHDASDESSEEISPRRRHPSSFEEE